MKKVFIIAQVLLLILSLTGCGVKQKIENKVGEKITEKIIESATGDKNTKIDIDGDKVVIKDKESGSEATFGGTEWPKIKSIPEFKNGKVISVIEDGQGSAIIMLENVEQKDFENYWEKIKEDFTENIFEMNSGGAISFAGENNEGFGVQLTYDSNNKSLSVVTFKK